MLLDFTQLNSIELVQDIEIIYINKLPTSDEKMTEFALKIYIRELPISLR